MWIMQNPRSSDPYKLLGVSSNATEQEIKKAFRKESMTCHPDKLDDNDPDREAKISKFTKLNDAKELLLNPKLRQAYDRGGWDLVQHTSESMRMMEQRRLKCDPIVVYKDIKLSQLYNRETIKMEIDVPIHHEDGTVENTTFPMEFTADTLGRIVAQNAGMQKPDHITGDIMVVAQLESDCPFQIKGVDLVYTAKIGLRDLLAGYKVVIPHPVGDLLITGHYNYSDDENVLIYPGRGLKAGSGRPGGNLVVLFQLDLEQLKDLDSTTISSICKLLDKRFGTKSVPLGIKDISSEARHPSQVRRPGMGLEQMMFRAMDGPMEVTEGQGCPMQ